MPLGIPTLRKIMIKSFTKLWLGFVSGLVWKSGWRSGLLQGSNQYALDVHKNEIRWKKDNESIGTIIKSRCEYQYLRSEIKYRYRPCNLFFGEIIYMLHDTWRNERKERIGYNIIEVISRRIDVKKHHQNEINKSHVKSQSQ